METKKVATGIIISLLIGVAGVSAWHYLTILKEKQVLQEAIREKEENIASLDKQNKALQDQLQAEKQIQENLRQEKVTVEVELKQTQGRLSEVTAELGQKKGQIAELNTNMDNLGKENQALQQDNANLQAQVTGLKEETDKMASRFNSLQELKKAIVELKRRMWASRTKPDNKAAGETTNDGNKGFVLIGGKSTFKPKVNIKVVPSH